MAISFTSKSSLRSNEHIEIVLILLAIFCQFFTCIGLHFITNTYGIVDRSSITSITNAFLVTYFMLSFVGKVGGTYFLGKLAEQFHFFTVMRLIAIGHALISIFMFAIFIAGKDFYGLYICFYAARFFHSCLLFATIVLPALYLFDRWPVSQHILIGTYIMLAKYSAKFCSRILLNYLPFSQIKIIYSLSIVLPFVSLIIYSYRAKYSSIVASKPTALKRHLVPLKDKVFYAFIGGVWSIGFHYYSSFLSFYLKNICVVKICILIDEKFTASCAYLLSLCLAAKICEKLGAFKMLVFSLSSLLILGCLIPLMVMATDVSMVGGLYLLFLFFSTCLFAPILTFLYQFYKSSKSIFDTLFWFVLGSSISKLLICFGSRLGFSQYVPLAGMWIFIGITLVCLVGILKFSPQENTFYRKMEN